MSSQYGSGSGGQYGSSGSSPFTWHIPKTKAAPSHHHGSSLFGNLLSDTISTAKGIPMGLVGAVEHPIRAAKQTVAAEKQMYSPLVHGHFGQFLHQVHAHPLGPLLDALSIASLGAAGVGLGVRGSAALAEAGGATADTSAVVRAAAHFRPGTEFTTRSLPTSIAGHNEVQALSSNVFRRSIQHGSAAILHGAAKAHVPLLKEGGALDYTELGRGNRLLSKTVSKRTASTRAALKHEVMAGYAAGKKGASIGDIGSGIVQRFDKGFLREAIPVEAASAERLSRHMPFGYIAKQKPTFIALRDTSPEGIHDFATGLGGRLKLVRDPAKAMTDAHGNPLLVRKSLPQAMTNELDGTHDLIKAIHTNPTRVWKAFILAQSPRFFVNNVVGNTTMLAAATHPVALTRGVLDAIRSVHGIRAAVKAERRMGNIADAEINKYLPEDVVSQHFGYLQHGALGLNPDSLAGAGKVKAGVTGGLYGVTEKVAYRATQRAGIMAALRSIKSFRDLEKNYRSMNMTKAEAFQHAARESLGDPRISATVEKKVTDWAGQYYHMNELEKKVSALVPFYNWDRHALRFAKEQVLERPAQSAALAQLGDQGQEATKKALGDIPDFLEGAIPVSGNYKGILGAILGGQVPGRHKVILTSGLNPLAAAAEDVHALAALVGAHRPGEAVGGQLNPLISGAISGLTGQRLFSGAKVHHKGGIVGSALAETYGQLPQVTIAKTLLQGTPKPKPNKRTGKTKPFLYSKDARQQISSMLGLSEREVNLTAAKALSNEQKGVRKGRKKKPKNPFKVTTKY